MTDSRTDSLPETSDAGDLAPPEPEPTLLTEPREGVPPVVNTDAGLRRAARALAAGTGPVSVDAERASGFRYGQRAFLVQLRREGSGTWLIDPVPFEDLLVVNEALSGAEWILHAATQDLPCLGALGMRPDALFDTELAGRLAGLPRVGLGPIVESLLGLRLAKEHSAADWSTRPLPEPWLRYAALDVEVLDELRLALIDLLRDANKLDFALQEFEAIRTAAAPAPRVDPWRRTSGLHQLRDRRQLAAVRALWNERESLAENRDVAPGRLIPDAALIAAAKAMPSTVPQLLKTPGFHGRAASKEAPRWLRCLQHARTEDDLPPMHIASSAPPPARTWPDKDEAAARRLATAKPRIARRAEELDMPIENLLTPDTLRRIAWRPPARIDPESITAKLVELGARPWQVEQTAPIITVAFLDPEPLPQKGAAQRS